MSSWNGRAFLRFLSRVLFKNRGTNYRLTAKRLGVLLLALAIYLPAELLIWLGLWLDELIYPGYRDLDLPRPLFIIGNPRSGTTFLQRTLAKDLENFHCMHTWEIFAAPSISGRRIIHSMAQVARAIGLSITKRVRRLERVWRESNAIHRLMLRSPEEDEYLFIHIFSTMKIWSFAALEDEAQPYIYFDEMVSGVEKDHLMDFYESCIRRHYSYHGGSKKRYLSKNPNFSPAVSTLLDRFPNAQFVYLVRNPLDAVPSHISLKDREWHLLGSPLERYSCRDFIIRSSRHWYDYPLNMLEELPEDQAVIVLFDDLVANTKTTVEAIYKQFGLSLTPDFEKLLLLETDKARSHESRHQYSLEEMGLDPEELRREFANVFEEFTFKDN